MFALTSAVSYLFSRDIYRHSLNGLTFCHLSLQNYTGFATYAGSTKRPLFLTKWVFVPEGLKLHQVFSAHHVFPPPQMYPSRPIRPFSTSAFVRSATLFPIASHQSSNQPVIHRAELYITNLDQTCNLVFYLQYY